jgi:hypothetical protein
MAKVVPFRKPMRADEFETNVRDRSNFSHMVFMTPHIKERMKKRNISQRQVLNALCKGSCAENPVFNEAKASYEGKMRHTGTGTEIVVVCAIVQSNLIVTAITVY